MIKGVLVALALFVSGAGFGQIAKVSVEDLTVDAEKGSYAILEVRFNNEDEFRTVDGNTAGLGRLAIFTGNNREKEVYSSDFNGFNSVVQLLNKFSVLKWNVVETYTFKGSSLVITHYLLRYKS